MSSYEIPDWAGKAPTGLHLDVLKDGKLIQKLMIDEKRCYLFGRNAQLNDFCVDHASCSRVHAALVYHKHLNRAFLVDLASTHGTFIGHVRLESQKPTQLPIDSNFHFGASTRSYIIRERPQAGPRPIMDELEKSASVGGSAGGAQGRGGLLGLPETETELDNLTEFNTAHNRRISMLGIPAEDQMLKKKRRIRLTFREDEIEEIINPEDVDPTVGRFRNMIESTVIPSKRSATPGLLAAPEPPQAKRPHLSLAPPGGSGPRGLYDGLDSSAHSMYSISSKLGLAVPNPAPEIELAPPASVMMPPPVMQHQQVTTDSNEPLKKKYAKEAWPGRKNPLMI